MKTIQTLIESNSPISELLRSVLESKSYHSELEYKEGERHNNGEPAPLSMDDESRLLRVYDNLVSMGLCVEKVMENIFEDHYECIALVVTPRFSEKTLLDPFIKGFK